jgi:hypothetical protein
MKLKQKKEYNTLIHASTLIGMQVVCEKIGLRENR